MISGIVGIYLIIGIIINLIVIQSILTDEESEAKELIHTLSNRTNNNQGIIVTIILLAVQLFWPIILTQGIIKIWDNKQ